MKRITLIFAAQPTFDDKGQRTREEYAELYREERGYFIETGDARGSKCQVHQFDLSEMGWESSKIIFNSLMPSNAIVEVDKTDLEDLLYDED